MCSCTQKYTATQGFGVLLQARLPEEPQLPELDSSGCNDCEPPEADPFGLDALITQDKR